MKKVWNTPEVVILNVSKTKQGGDEKQEQTVPGNPAHHGCSADAPHGARCEGYIS